MKKEELEAIFGDDEYAPELGPIDDYLHAVATEPELPDFAVGMCTARIEEAAPKLRAVLLRVGSRDTISVTSRTCLCRWIGRAAPKTSSTSKLSGPILSQTSRSGIPGATSAVTVHVPAGAARKPRNAALLAASRRREAGRRKPQCAVIHARASR